MLSLEKTRPVWAEVNLDYLEHNLEEIKRLVRDKTMITGVIKANAYGHGAIEVADVLINNGIDRLAVATLSEALELRRVYEDIPILILGYTQEASAEEVIKNKITQTIFTLKQAKTFSEKAKELNKDVILHIKIDTGMSRIGFRPDRNTVQIIKEIVNLPNVVVEGIFTHFAVADQRDKTFTFKQFERFKNLCYLLEKEDVKIPIKHVANSAAIMDLSEMHLDMVRAGIILYGLYPSDEVRKDFIKLKPLLSLKTKIDYIKEVDKGVGISYGLTYVTDKKSKIATIPIGYADGFTRMLSGKGEVLVNGKKAPVVGRICMDQCMIDVTDISDAKIGDEVILIGADGENSISADDLAKKLNTINYEIVCMVGRRIPRVYIKNNKIVKIKDYLFDKKD
ncbi:alanine racemase [Crassaminicella thermophila]|uniref:Alanine racemase n=1 Tax=Crassaminicella thermophila TaxID=2599308 RepID=A0A5C0SBG9_CRATE|nr:alanine racemase [Crassaminicella thermophila]QEK11440.1 alanine racemase [Crassaminicella thermophila]